MDKRIILVALVGLLFWLAPKPNASQAHERPAPVRAREITPDQRIVITPYIKAAHAK